MPKNRLRVRIVNHVDAVTGLAEKALKRKVSAMGHTVRNKALTQVLVGERTGKWYYVPGTRRLYRASSPGEPPATRTGDLRRSVKVGSVQGTFPNYFVHVGSDLKYALELEVDMDRKWLEPAAQLAQPDIHEIARGDWGI